MRSNRYVSYLATEIEPRAFATLNRFEQATAAAFKNIESFANKGSSRLGVGGIDANQTRAIAATSTALRTARSEFTQTGAAMRRAGQEGDLLSTSFFRTAQALNVVQGPLGPLAGRLSSLGYIFRDLAGISLAGVLGGGAAFGLANIAGSYQKVTDRLRPFYDSQVQVNAALADVTGIAQRTRQALDPVASLYTRLAQAGKDVGISQDRTTRLTETVSKAARLSGGDQQTQSAGLGQFAQGFGSGNLGGDELRSIKENTFRLAKALADGLDVPIAKLKELGSEGLLTPQLIAAALERSADQIDAEFQRIPIRIGAALQLAENNLSIFIGKLDETTGATQGVAKAIALIGNNIPTVVAFGAAALVAFNARNFAGAAMAITDYAARLGAATAGEYARIQAIVSGQTVERAAAQVSAQRAAAAVAAAKAEVVAQQQAVAAATVAQAQLQKSLVLIEAQRAAQVRALATAQTLAAAGGSSGAAVAAQQALNATLAARIRTEQLLTATNAELAVSERALTAAGVGLAATQTAAAAAIGTIPARATVAATSLALLARAQAGLAAATRGLVGLLGGPLGVAFTVAAGAAAYFASQTNAALDAANNFAGGQDALRRSLGLTTAFLDTATESARNLTRELARGRVEESRTKVRAAGGDLAGSLTEVASGINGFSSPQARRDRREIERLRDKARSGTFDPRTDLDQFTAIRDRNPNAFKGGITGRLQSLLGVRPEDTAKKALGVGAAMRELGDSLKAFNEVESKLGKPRAAAPKIPTSLNAAQLDAAARRKAATTDLARAKADLASIKATGRQENETQDAYVDRLSQAYQRVTQLAAAQKGAKSASSAHAKAIREETAALKDAQERADKLANVLSRFSDEPSLFAQGERAKRQVDDAFRVIKGGKVSQLPSIRVGDQDVTRDQARAKIDEGVRKPIEDRIRSQERELEIGKLRLAGLSTEADLLQTAYELHERTGKVTADDLARIEDNIVAQDRLNDATEKRNAILDNTARVLGEGRAAFKDFFSSALAGDGVGAVKGLVSRLQDTLRNAMAEKLTLEIFGDPEKAFRDEMTRGLDGSAARLVTSSGKLDDAARALTDAAASVSGMRSNGPDAVATMSGIPDALAEIYGSGGAGGARESIYDKLAKSLEKASDAMLGTTESLDNSVVATEDIVATALKKDSPGEKAKMLSPTAAIDRLIRKFSVGLGINDESAKKIGGVFSKALEGSVIGSAIGGLIGGRGGASTGAAIGGAVSGGLAALSNLTKNSKSGIGASINSISEKLGPAVQAIAAAFEIGQLIGGFLKKAPRAGAVITGVNSRTPALGNNQQASNNVATLAGGVQGGVQRIADMFGVTPGDFKVSIGQYKDWFRVSASGAANVGEKKFGRGGPADLIYNGTDPEAATRAALLNAIQDGAVKGIRAGSQRLLAAGKDLDQQVNKALKFEAVFTRLKEYTDPVGAAIDKLNKEFSGLITIFNEAGASSAEFADLQKLYDLQRLDAIKQASQETVQALDDFLKSNLSGADSPLSRQTVYTNARADLDAFRGDVAAGKPIDQEKLIRALDDFKAASQTINGSRSAFFQDFDDLIALAQKARSNVTTSIGLPTDPNTAPSPFDAAKAANDNLNAANTTNTLLEQGFAAMVAAIKAGNLFGGGGAGGGSSIGLLPGFYSPDIYGYQ